MKHHLLACSAAFILAPWLSQASAQEVPKTDFDYDALIEELPIESDAYGPPLTFDMYSGGVINFYGQLNPAYQGFNDGEETTSNLVDNGNWNSRVGFTIVEPADGITLRARFETGLGLRSSALVSQDYTPDAIDWQPRSLRWFEVAGEGSLGTVSLGQGSMASDGTAGLDDSATFVAGATDSSDGFGSFRFRDSDGKLTNVTVGQVNSNFNGARRFRARYDTPVVEGVMLSTSLGKNVLVEEDNTTYYDAAIRWTGTVGDFAIRAAAGYQWLDNPDTPDTRRLAGSMTVVHEPTGLNLAVSAGEQVGGASYVWGRLGWRNQVFDLGPTALSVDYYYGQDFLSEGARTENYGIYAVQTFDALSVDLYGGVRKFTYSAKLGTDYQDAYGILTGMRFFF
ncbi:hypothetical protein [Aestuariivirga sp.]|uniref:hypothetical protein n=1 Tax=Aestuariivirga sp. TaxID=2650926 RepID=UPI0035B0C87F